MKILFRESLAEEEEFYIASKYCDVIEFRSLIPTKELIVPRYSVLPYPEELGYDVAHRGSELINPVIHHKFIADFDYYDYVKDYTFRSWNYEDFFDAPEGQYVIKGKTNSKKFYWNQSMFCESKSDVYRKSAGLTSDSMIGSQGIVVREYTPLKRMGPDFINGLPFTEEYRFFILDGKIISSGFYWSISDENPKTPQKAIDFVYTVINALDPIKIRFYVLDIGIKEDGNPILVEMNDACMSGLSNCCPHELYKNLSDSLKG